VGFKATVSRQITRRKVQIALGLLWLLDGALQLQRQMFSSSFVNKVMEPSASGQPAIVSGPIHFAAHIILTHPAIWDLCFGLIQLSLGFFILFKKTARYGLIGSVFWALGIWLFGEGLGGLFSGNASLLMGAPGAALLYAIIALGVLPKGEQKRPAKWLAIVWAILWLGGSVLQLGSAQNTPANLSSMISSMSIGAPGWLATLDRHVASYIHRSNEGLIILLVVVQALIGILVLLPKYYRKLAISAGIVLSIGFWAVGQAFGGYYTGLATDPSTAPLVILLGIAILGSQDIVLNLF
jgi:hypothetical protein